MTKARAAAGAADRAEATIATYDDFLTEYQRLQKA